jgi:hypothetical protein
MASISKSNEYTRENLEEMTVKELRRLCVDVLQIPGLTKKRKEIIIDGIMLAQEEDATNGAIQGVAFEGHSVMTKPDGAFGQKTTTTIRVSCGASSGAFPVVGKTVAEVGEFLREVLNVDKLSTGLVNGKEVPGDHELRVGDSLEFMKPAGRKGC